jgi:hypothetical protein
MIDPSFPERHSILLCRHQGGRRKRLEAKEVHRSSECYTQMVELGYDQRRYQNQLVLTDAPWRVLSSIEVPPEVRDA